MSQILSYIETQNPDRYHSLGQTLLRPLSIAFGHTFKLEKEIQEIQFSTTKKIISIACTILLLPVALSAYCIGAILITLSSSHKKDYEQIQQHLISKKFIDPKNPKKTTDTVDNYTFEQLKKIADGLLVGSYSKFVDQSIYEIQYQDVDMSNICFEGTPPVAYPQTPEEIKIYHDAIPAIVSHARDQVQEKLEKAVPISQLLKAIHENYYDLFPHYKCLRDSVP